MRTVQRLLPILVGLALGYVLISPPGWLSALGAWRWLGVAVFVLAALLAFTAYQISANLPAHPAFEPAAESEVTGELRSLCGQLEALGFRRIGPPWTVGVSPPALLVALVNEAERTYATAFRTSTIPSKTAFDCVSVLEGDRGGLTTGAEPAGAMSPAARGSLRQVFPGAGVGEVYRRHRESLQFLCGRGLRPKAVSASTFRADFELSFRLQRAAFTSAPLRGTVVTFWRVSTGRTPHIGPVAQQRAARAVLAELQTGLRG